MQMNNANYDKIINTAHSLGCRVIENAPLKEYTTFKVGGNCSALIFINSEESAAKLFSSVNEEKASYFLMGRGSNILFSDNGFDGIILQTGKDFSKIRMIDECTIECDAGTPLAKAAYFAYENSLTGFEFAWGIPGNVGGAVFMNAGAYGGEIKDIIFSASCVNDKGDVLSFNKDELELGYRHSVFSNNGYLITKASFRLHKGDKQKIRARMDELMGRRKDKQPLEYGSAGSTFKRPEGSYASLLIEQCGLKGLHVGDAEVSTKHSGFIINKGNATCNDILCLIDKVKENVFEKTGYKLECEVRIVPPTIVE